MRAARLRSLLSALPVPAALLLLVLYPEKASAAACEGVRQSLGQVFPALFPFFVLAGLLLHVPEGRTPGAGLSRLSRRLFAVPVSALPVFLVGLVSGCPVGAAAAAELYRQGGCTRAEAERLLVYASNCGPAFLLGVIAPRLSGGTKDALFLLAAQVLVSVWLGALLAGGSPSPERGTSARRPSVPFPRAFTDAMRSGGRNALMVCAYVVFFAAITAFLPPLPLIRGLAELTGGVLLLTPEQPLSLVTAAFLMGFGGLSVGCQVLAAISDAGLSGKLYFPFRALHGLMLACAAFLYERSPLLLPLLGLGLFFSAFCVRRGRKRRESAVYC